MTLKVKRWILFTPILFMLAFSFSGCASFPKKTITSPPSSSVEEEQADRRIDVIQKMRTQAVSRRVGRWAVVVGI